MKKKPHESVKKENIEVETKLEDDAPQAEEDMPDGSSHSKEETGEFESKKKLYGLGQKVFVITIVATVIIFVAWLLTA